MADNVVVSAGTGTTIGADEVVDGTLGTVKVQYVKLMDGTLDGTTKAAVGANGLKVDPSGATSPISAASLPLPALAATSTKQSDGTQKTQVVDGSGNVQPSGDTVARALFEKITDGTNTATVKAASTAPVTATDAALVTVLRQDSAGIISTGTFGSPNTAMVLSVQGGAGGTPLPIGGVTVVQAASSTITRPADTTAYTSGDLVANSVTAGSVTNLQFTTLARVSGGSGVIIGAQIQKSGPIVTNAAFRLHLFNTAPTYTSAGDNSAIATVVVASAKGYLGYIDITTMVGFSDVAWGSGAPDNSRGGIPYVATAQIIYGLLEARGAYTPISAEVFTISVDALQD